MLKRNLDIVFSANRNNVEITKKKNEENKWLKRNLQSSLQLYNKILPTKNIIGKTFFYTFLFLAKSFRENLMVKFWRGGTIFKSEYRRVAREAAGLLTFSDSLCEPMYWWMKILVLEVAGLKCVAKKINCIVKYWLLCFFVPILNCFNGCFLYLAVIKEQY